MADFAQVYSVVLVRYDFQLFMIILSNMELTPQLIISTTVECFGITQLE